MHLLCIVACSCFLIYINTVAAAADACIDKNDIAYIIHIHMYVQKQSTDDGDHIIIKLPFKTIFCVQREGERASYNKAFKGITFRH